MIKQFLSYALFFMGMIMFCACPGPEKEARESPEADTGPDEIGKITQMILSDSLNASLYHERALLYLQNGRINEALGDLGDAIEIAPENADFYVTLGDAYLAMGDVPNCLVALQEAEELQPGNIEALLKLAEVYLILKDYNNTFLHVKKALELDTRNPKAYFIRGFALMEMGDTAAAVRNMQNALDQDQHYYEAAVQLGLLFSGKRDPLAEQYLRAAIAMEPNREAAYYFLGLFYQNTVRMELAIETYDKLLVLNPGFKEAYYNMGYIYLVHYEDFTKAAEFFSRAIEQDPRYLDAYFNRGYSYELSADYGRARQDYQKALQIKPNYERAVEGLNRLDRMQGY